MYELRHQVRTFVTLWKEFAQVLAAKCRPRQLRLISGIDRLGKIRVRRFKSKTARPTLVGPPCRHPISEAIRRGWASIPPSDIAIWANDLRMVKLPQDLRYLKAEASMPASFDR